MIERVTIESNGVASGPAQALSLFLSGERVIQHLVSHPLNADTLSSHQLTVIRSGEEVSVTTFRRPFQPPLSFLFDLLTPLIPPPSEVWFSFSPLTSLRAIIHRRLGRTRYVIHWSVDFVPKRFESRALNGFYHHIDKFVCKRADLRIDLSQRALEERRRAHSLPESENAIVVPMGFWKSSSRTTGTHVAPGRLVFLGHLVERMGVKILPDLMDQLVASGRSVHLDVIGTGPLYEWLDVEISRRGLRDHVTLHGFVKESSDVQRILSNSTIALAPYVQDADNFTQYADPGKLKDYVGAGLPIVLSPVPPNSQELESAGVALLADDSPREFLDKLLEVLDNHDEWLRRHNACLAYRERYTWEKILGDLWQQVSVELN